MNRKVVLTAFVSLLLLATLGIHFMIVPVTAVSTTIYVDDDGTKDFRTIQEAIDSPGVKDGDTIFVCKGTYYEQVVVHKTLSLVGENKHGTIIDGNGTIFVVNVRANNIKLSGFTIQNGEQGIWLWYSSNNVLSGNIVSNCSYGMRFWRASNNILNDNDVSNSKYGILLEDSSNNVLSGNIVSNSSYGTLLSYSSNNVLSGNTISNCSYGTYLSYSSNNILSGNDASNSEYGLYLDGSSYNNLTGNDVSSNNEYGIRLYHSGDNVLSGNIVSNSSYGIYVGDSGDNVVSGSTVSDCSYGIYLSYSSNNIIFHNNFVNNTNQAVAWGSYNNVWDDGYPSGGDYWSDYGGTDANRDGIGDIPYTINENNRDNYPLMAMLLQFNIATEDMSYKIDVVCNSTISDFQTRYDVYNRINAVSFKANGAEGRGFCRICIPHVLIEPPYTVTVDYEPPLYSKIVYTNGTHTWLYFTYEHSEHEVMVMHTSSPEQFVFLPQWAIFGLTVTVIILLSISIHYYRIFSKQKKVIQTYERELGSFPLIHSERARARFIKDVIEREEKIEKFKKKYSIKIQPARTLKDVMEKLGVQKEKEKS